jgi:hypothetical protein
VQGLIKDAHTNPGLLWRRARARMDAALEGTGQVPSGLPRPANGTPERDAVSRLSSAQLVLFGEFFPNGAGGIDFTAFQGCFERFANGEVRDPSNPDHLGLGEPNGGNYFLFAEFAFLCVDLDQDKAAWARVLRAFVKTQEMFMHVYREGATSPPPPVTAPPPRSGVEQRDILPMLPTDRHGFDAGHFRSIGGSPTRGLGQSDFARKMALRTKYDSMDVNALARAARDNLQRAVRMK